MRCFIVAPLDGERCGVHADLDGCGPVGVHLSVLVMIAFKLQLQIRSVGYAENVFQCSLKDVLTFFFYSTNVFWKNFQWKKSFVFVLHYNIAFITSK